MHALNGVGPKVLELGIWNSIHSGIPHIHEWFRIQKQWRTALSLFNILWQYSIQYHWHNLYYSKLNLVNYILTKFSCSIGCFSSQLRFPRDWRFVSGADRLISLNEISPQIRFLRGLSSKNHSTLVTYAQYRVASKLDSLEIDLASPQVSPSRKKNAETSAGRRRKESCSFPWTSPSGQTHDCLRVSLKFSSMFNVQP